MSNQQTDLGQSHWRDVFERLDTGMKGIHMKRDEEELVLSKSPHLNLDERNGIE